MKIKHEHIRMAMNVWAHPDGEKVPAAKITKAYFELGMTFPELYDDSHPEALARNTQKIFRWLDKDTPDAVEKMQALLPQVLRYQYRRLQHRKILKQKLWRTLCSRCHRLLKRERMTWFYHHCIWQTANCVGRKIMSRSGSESAPRCGS